jgi:hypothetical protein
MIDLTKVLKRSRGGCPVRTKRIAKLRKTMEGWCSKERLGRYNVDNRRALVARNLKKLEKEEQLHLESLLKIDVEIFDGEKGRFLGM